MMETESICSKIKDFLSISDKPFNLEQKINTCFDSEKEKKFIANILLNFVHNFSMFKEIKPFMESVYSCILKTLEIEFDSIEDFNELLIKNAIMHFIQQYIEYSKLQQKRQVLKFLSDSLEKLQVRPLIINLGLMLKPMYQDQEYLNKLKKSEEIEVI